MEKDETCNSSSSADLLLTLVKCEHLSFFFSFPQFVDFRILSLIQVDYT